MSWGELRWPVSKLAGIVLLQVNLSLESKAAHGRKAQKAAKGGADYRRQKSGHSFSAANPYGQKQSGDQRQFVRL